LAIRDTVGERVPVLMVTPGGFASPMRRSTATV
jgi:hypothetical protein